jgi:hypothetical protein
MSKNLNLGYFEYDDPVAVQREIRTVKKKLREIEELESSKLKLDSDQIEKISNKETYERNLARYLKRFYELDPSRVLPPQVIKDDGLPRPMGLRPFQQPPNYGPSAPPMSLMNRNPEYLEPSAPPISSMNLNPEYLEPSAPPISSMNSGLPSVGADVGEEEPSTGETPFGGKHSRKNRRGIKKTNRRSNKKTNRRYKKTNRRYKKTNRRYKKTM